MQFLAAAVAVQFPLQSGSAGGQVVYGIPKIPRVDGGKHPFKVPGHLREMDLLTEAACLQLIFKSGQVCLRRVKAQTYCGIGIVQIDGMGLFPKLHKRI